MLKKISIWGSVASIASLILFFFPLHSEGGDVVNGDKMVTERGDNVQGDKVDTSGGDYVKGDKVDTGGGDYVKGDKIDSRGGDINMIKIVPSKKLSPEFRARAMRVSLNSSRNVAQYYVSNPPPAEWNKAEDIFRSGNAKYKDSDYVGAFTDYQVASKLYHNIYLDNTSP